MNDAPDIAATSGMRCVDLQQRFGDRFRLQFEARGASKVQWPREDWPWLLEVRCRYGVIYPVGGELLAACTSRRLVGRKLRALPGAIAAKGDAETVVAFHVDRAEAVFAVLKPYRRRRVAASERERLRGIGDRSRFGRMHGVQSEQTDPRIDDREAVEA